MLILVGGITMVTVGAATMAYNLFFKNKKGVKSVPGAYDVASKVKN